MHSRISIISCECYANKAIAYIALENINKRVYIRHRDYMGRDVILEEIKIFAKKAKPGSKYIAIIDKEIYSSSAFINELCRKGERMDIVFGKIYTCKTKYGNADVLLVIFDPNIEEAFLCKLDKRICNEYKYKNMVKNSKKGTKYVRNLLNKFMKNNGQVKEVITKIKNSINKILSESEKDK